jgi:putative transposase
MKKQSMSDLIQFIGKSKSKQGITRALAVKMYLEGNTLKETADNLSVSYQFVGKWKNQYLKHGVQALKLGYRGSKSYLSQKEKQTVIHWLQPQQCCTLEALQHYIIQDYDIRFKSLQSYYQLFKEADMSFKKTQKVNPKRNLRVIAAKRYALKKVA